MTPNEWIYTVVDKFYDKAKTDILIGYHFRVIEDFDEHIPRIASFWELQLLGRTEKKIDAPFDLIRAHSPLNIKKGELYRWLLLFKETLNDLTKEHPEMSDLRNLWLMRLDIFEKIFLRSFGL